MAITKVNLGSARPSTVSQGDTPLGAYKGTVVGADLETKDNGQQIIKLRVLISEGTNPEGIGFTPQATCNLPSAASGKNEKFFADRTAGLYLSFGYKPEQFTKDDFSIDTEKHMMNKELHVYCEPRVTDDGFPRVEYMTKTQYDEFVAGKFKIAPKSAGGGAKKDGGGGAGKGGGSNTKAANDLDDDIPANGAGKSTGTVQKSGGSATSDLDL